ncbi:MAG: RNA 2',3'-cyclic phosphodiesterase [Candidatus Latescibacterota bacterium]|nr:MAG: RNA 2',3'-cyclic phosphodiesterase [Candidatus Latescibacterota bacterium]
MRLFFAVGFDDSLKDAISTAIDKSGLAHPPWRWVARDNFHITMKFLGEMPQDRVSPLVMSAMTAFRGSTPFAITLGEMGGFPNLRRPRILFYTVTKGGDELAALANRLDASLNNDLGIDKERRPFRAHATVARIKKPIDPHISYRLQSAPGVEHPPQLVDRVLLMRSELRREGALYHVVKEIALE